MDALVVTPLLEGSLLHPCGKLPRLVRSERPVADHREASINLQRHELQRIVRLLYRKRFRKVFLIDADVVVTEEHLRKLYDAVKTGTTACLQTKPTREEGHVCAACACINMEDYLSIDYLDNIKECQCKKVPSPFYVDWAVTEENYIRGI